MGLFGGGSSKQSGSKSSALSQKIVGDIKHSFNSDGFFNKQIPVNVQVLLISTSLVGTLLIANRFLNGRV